MNILLIMILVNSFFSIIQHFLNKPGDTLMIPELSPEIKLLGPLFTGSREVFARLEKKAPRTCFPPGFRCF